MIPIPKLQPPNTVEPIQLRRSVSQLPKGGAFVAQPSSGELNAARTLVERHMSGTGPGAAPRRLVPALARLLQSEDAKPRRNAIVDLILATESISWRRLWNLWENAPDFSERIVPELAWRIWHSVGRSSRFRKRLPAWLPTRSEREIAAALSDPMRLIRTYCENGRIPLTELPGALNLMNASPLGRYVMSELVRRGSHRWWSQMPPSLPRSWADERGGLILISAVANRQLLEVGDTRHGGMISRRAEKDELASWVLRAVGDPVHRPGRWAHISDPALQIFESLLLDAELAKIMEEFRQNAEDDRAAYWSRKVSEVRDARYIAARDTAVCMMLLPPILAIEFGSTGNACYFYRAPSSLPRLRAVSLPKKVSARWFKSRTELELGTTRIPYVHKLSHMSRWQSKFNDFLLEENAVRW